MQILERPRRNALIKFAFTPRQLEAWHTLISDLVDELLYGGAKGGGKSVFLCMAAYTLAKMIMRFFNLPICLNPRMIPIIGFLGRKRSVDFSASTLSTWKREIPSQAYRIGEIDDIKVIILEERVAIQIGGLDDEKAVKKFNSAEYAFCGIDQAEECTEQDLAMLRGTLRLQLPVRDAKGVVVKDAKGNEQRKPPSCGYKVILTANPAECSIKRDFITNRKPRMRFVPALPADNPFLPPTYEEQLRQAFSYSPSLLAAYLHGSWDNVGDPQTLIPYEWIKAAVGRPKNFKPIVIHGNDTMIVVSAVAQAFRELNADSAYIDVIGVGAGVHDRLKQMGFNVFAVNVAENAQNEERFHRLRDEIWWGARESLNPERYANRQNTDKVVLGVDVARGGDDDSVIQPLSGPIGLPDDPDLISDLASVRLDPVPDSNGRILIEKKEDLKERIGRSPDKGDAYCMAVYGLLGILQPAVAWNDGSAIHAGAGGHAGGGAWWM